MGLLSRTAVGRALRGWMARPPRPRRRVFHYENVLGTSLELHVIAESSAAARRAERETLAEVDRLEAILSGWSATSELARWLGSFETSEPVSAELAEVLRASEAWRTVTGGAFDPAAQAIVEDLRANHEPGPELLGEPGAPRWIVDHAATTARRVTRHAISLDAIAKGYIVSSAARRVARVEGVSDVLLNIGGDVQHLGAHAVTIGVADPSAPAENAPPIAAVRIENAALATSGGYRRGIITNGRRVSHIVDPRTARPVEHIASASVLAADCTTADALSTAFSVMDPLESVALADTLADVGCLLVTSGGSVITNSAWDARAVALTVQDSHKREKHG